MPTPRRRRWFQFGLASLLWLMLLIALTVIGVIDYRMRDKVTTMEAEVERLTSANAALEANRQNSDYLEMELRLRLIEAGNQIKQAKAEAASAP